MNNQETVLEKLRVTTKDKEKKYFSENNWK
jgi:hypothetical protein